MQGSMHWCLPGKPALAEPSREGLSPQPRQDDGELAHHGVPAFLHLARAHQVPMRAPAGAEGLQPRFLHQLSMRLETALLRGYAILRGRCCESGAEGGQNQDGQNRLFHELLLQRRLRQQAARSFHRSGLPTKLNTHERPNRLHSDQLVNGSPDVAY